MRPSWLVIGVLAMSSVAHAEDPPAPAPEDGGADYFPAPTGKDIVVVIPGERTTRNIELIAGLAGGALVAGGIGVYYNLDSKSAADAVSAHEPIGKTWTPGDQANVARAHDSAVRAAIGYSVGGAFALAAAITLVVTEPHAERRVIHPHGTGKPIPTVAPAPGGALLGGQWSF